MIELSDGAIRYDRTVKLRLYANADIAETWIVDLGRRTVDVHRGPIEGAYAATRSYGPDDSVTLSMAPDIDIAIALELVFG